MREPPRRSAGRVIHVVPVAERVPYRMGLAWQRRLAREKISGRLQEDVVLLLEHEPVLTLGRASRLENLVAGPELLAERGIDVVEVERGGDVTYHGPGQLVGYPIIDLRRYRCDLHWYLRRLEEALITALSGLGLEAFGVPAYTGVWVGDETRRSPADRAEGRIRKVASIGVHVSRWVTWHGFALNVTREPLRSFELIVPCGIGGVHMTSLAAEGASTDPGSVRRAIGRGLGAAFEAAVHVSAAVAAGAPVALSPRHHGPSAGRANRAEAVSAARHARGPGVGRDPAYHPEPQERGWS